MMASRLIRTSLVRSVRPVAPISGARFQSTQAVCRPLAVRPAASLMPRSSFLPASISFHSTARLKQQAAPVSGDVTEKLSDINQQFRDTVVAKSGMTLERWQHAGALGLAVSCPSLLFFTFIYEPSRILTLPVDVILALAGPIHGYIGLEAVLTDYVTIRPLQNILKFLSLVGFFLAVLGLLKIAFFDGGLAKAYGAFWTRNK